MHVTARTPDLRFLRGRPRPRPCTLRRAVRPFAVTVLDYRGFGGSGGSPTEMGLIYDGAAAFRWLRERQQRRPALGAPPRRPVLWGESIGTGVAVALLAGDDDKAKAGGGAVASDTSAGPLLVLEAGFSSCVDLGVAA